MKKQILIVAVSALAISTLAQTTNEFRRGHGEGRPEWKKGDHPERQHKPRGRELTPEQMQKRQERRIQLMEKTLDKIGVTEEQRRQIVEMQQQHRKAMKAVMAKTDETRKKLSELEKAGAPQDQIYAAIDAVAEVQAEQMKLLARNKIDMKRILGREKYKQLMDAARAQYRKRGRRGEHGMPTRPDLPDDEKPLPPPVP